MPQAAPFEAPQGSTFHAAPLLQAVTEAFAGNGVLADGDATVTADTTTQMAVNVAQSDSGVAYGGTVFTPSAASFTLSDGPTTTTNGVSDRRVDLVFFDSSTGSYAVSEGAAAPNPTPPVVPDDGLMLSIVLVAHGATDISDSEILNWQARPNATPTLPSEGGADSSETRFGDGLYIGKSDGPINETASPGGFAFTAGDTRDVHNQVDVTVSNGSDTQTTEDVTVTLYDGASNAGTQLLSETRSVTLAGGASSTVTFIQTEQQLDGGDFFVEVTTSGAFISPDETVERTTGLVYSYVETDDGRHQLVNRNTGTAIFTVDPITDEIKFPNAAIDAPEIADGSITTAKLADDAATAAKIAADAVNSTQIAADAVGQAQIGALTAGVASVTNANSFGALFDIPVDSNSADGTLHSYTLDIGGNILVELRGKATGTGGVDGLEIRYHGAVDVNGNDIEDGAVVVYSTADGHVPRPQVDDSIVRSSVKTAAYTTADEEFVPVDASGTGGLTVTLASADATAGNQIIVKDVAGNAASNAITVATEGSETIDGQSSKVIDVSYGKLKVVGNGSDWDILNSPSRTVDPRNIFEGTETGAVAAGDQGVLTVDSIADGAKVEVFKAALTSESITAIPSGVDLKLVSFDNAGGFTTRSTLLSGDGTTVHDRVTGNPLAVFENGTGSRVSVGVIVDNQSGSSQSVVAKIEGTAPA